jgi:hypothetical protein
MISHMDVEADGSSEIEFAATRKLELSLECHVSRSTLPSRSTTATRQEIHAMFAAMLRRAELSYGDLQDEALAKSNQVCKELFGRWCLDPVDDLPILAGR